MSLTEPSPALGADPECCTVTVIGSGFAGLAMAQQLIENGVADVLLLERADAVGGTWRDNSYPGCACDVPSRLYSYSFWPKPDWSHRYARQPEIRQYLEDFVSEHGLRGRIRFGAEVAEARWDEAARRWRVQTTDGRCFRSQFLVAGVGGLKDPRYPDIPGKEGFQGRQLHSARWDASVDLVGKRVAVVGTGASAIQIVPSIAGRVDSLTVFQRSPAWVLPRMDVEYSSRLKTALAVLPGLDLLLRFLTWVRMEARYFAIFRQDGPVRRLAMALVRRHIQAEIPDPTLAAQLTPSYEMGCKRVLVSDDWYPAMRRDNVHLVGERVVELTETGLRSADGVHHEVDVIIWCTGFTVDQPLGSMAVIGQEGADLRTVWDGRPKGWLGITMSGFPNAFLLLGPNTALGHNSVVVMIEAQVRYTVQAIRYTLGLGADRSLDVDADAVQRFVEDVDRGIGGQVWQTGCQSWYLNERGENFTIWPGSTASYIWATRRFEPAVYRTG